MLGAIFGSYFFGIFRLTELSLSYLQLGESITKVLHCNSHYVTLAQITHGMALLELNRSTFVTVHRLGMSTRSQGGVITSVIMHVCVSAVEVEKRIQDISSTKENPVSCSKNKYLQYTENNSLSCRSSAWH